MCFSLLRDLEFDHMRRPTSLVLCFFLSGCATGPQWLPRVQHEQPPYVIYGSVVSDNGAKDGWVVVHRGVIVSVGSSESTIPKHARKYKYSGYIFPGLIDTHNHPQYNAIPRWRAAKKYKNRYEWIVDPIYRQNVEAVFAKLKEHHVEYAALKYGEVRALIGGTTSIQGTYAPPESNGLVRNISPTYEADAYTLDVRGLSDEKVQKIRSDLTTGQLKRYFLHVAEGVDTKSSEEFNVLQSKGLLRSGIVLIHGIALTREQFRLMRRVGAYLVWSPQSNLSLYGKTTDVVAAKEEGLTISLAPDWTITGTDNMLEELKVAEKYSKERLHSKVTARDLFRMATINAAKVAGLDQFLGRVAPRFGADFFLAPRLDPDPFKSLLKTNSRDVHMVFVDGVPLYGDEGEVEKFVDSNSIDRINVQGRQKVVVTVADPRLAPRSQEHFRDIVQLLQKSIVMVAPLSEDQ